ncbi:hypothetical protein [Myxococcus sp. Y35]|uniref:hypothetical protein n=1 Tax=Pseudomyxococcus flavus TaxID=3115648 RepID=UPI003CEBFDBE
MFRGDARGRGDASGIWAPEEGRGAMGGGWGARSDGGITGGGQGDVRSVVVEVGGNAEDLGGMELEAFDFEFQIASF